MQTLLLVAKSEWRKSELGYKRIALKWIGPAKPHPK